MQFFIILSVGIIAKAVTVLYGCFQSLELSDYLREAITFDNFYHVHKANCFKKLPQDGERPSTKAMNSILSVNIKERSHCNLSNFVR